MYIKISFMLFLSSLAYHVYGVSTQRQNRNCTCVPYYQCSEDSGKVITDGSDLLEERGYSKSACTGYFDVCCDLLKENTTNEPEEPKGCGYQKSRSFPWTVSLHHQESTEYPRLYKCGASLIHPQVVVTAAHCLTTATSPGIWTAQIGDTQRTIKKVIAHHDYNSISLQNDLALVILKNPVETSDNLNVICIPPPGIVLDETRCVLSSSKVPNFSLATSSALQLLKLPIVPPTKCVKALRQTRLGTYFTLHKSFLCAGGEANRDACGGDGGSPLVCPVSNQPGRFHQVGIVSWGIGCGENNVPGIYVNLAIFRDWIDHQMIANGFNVNAYRY